MSALPSRRPDPLIEILLRPTTDAVTQRGAARGSEPVFGSHPADEAAGQIGHVVGAAAGVGRPGTRAPWGETEAAILVGAARAVLLSGTQISVAQVAAAAGMAKAAVQAHYASPDDILTALLLSEIDRLASVLATADLSDALVRAATEISENPLLEAIGADDSAVLAMLSRVDVRSVGWSRVAAAVDELLWRSGRAGTPMVLRWLGSFVTAPADEADIEADVDVLVAGLPPRSQH